MCESIRGWSSTLKEHLFPPSSLYWRETWHLENGKGMSSLLMIHEYNQETRTSLKEAKISILVLYIVIGVRTLRWLRDIWPSLSEGPLPFQREVSISYCPNKAHFLGFLEKTTPFFYCVAPAQKCPKLYLGNCLVSQLQLQLCKQREHLVQFEGLHFLGSGQR